MSYLSLLRVKTAQRIPEKTDKNTNTNVYKSVDSIQILKYYYLGQVCIQTRLLFASLKMVLLSGPCFQEEIILKIPEIPVRILGV